MKRFTLFVCAVLCLLLMAQPILAGDMYKCQDFTKGFGWSQSYPGNMVEIDSYNLVMAGIIYDEMMSCYANTCIDENSSFMTDRGKGWGFFKTSRKSARLFPTSIAGSEVRLRVIGDGIFALWTKYGTLSGVHVFKKTIADKPLPEWLDYNLFDVLRYWFNGCVLDSLPKGDMKNQLALSESMRLTALYLAGQADMVKAIIAKKAGLDQDEHDPFRLVLFGISGAEPCHKVTELILRDMLFQDYEGVQVGRFKIGNWIMVRFAGSQLVHFIYAPDAELNI